MGKIIYQGKKMTISELAHETGMSYGTLDYRIKCMKLTADEAVNYAKYTIRSKPKKKWDFTPTKLTSENIEYDKCIDLVGAVCRAAIEDYKMAKKHKDEGTMQDTEKFFLNFPYAVGIDGEKILRIAQCD